MNVHRTDKAERTPLIDGERATFVWRGKNPPKLAGDFNDWETGRALDLEPIERGVWARTLEFPRDAYIEYAFFRGEKRVPDPLNPCTTPNGLGATSHFFYMPDAAPTPLTRRQADNPPGEVTRHTVETDGMAVGQRRTVYLYQPFTPEPCPLVVVFDGPDYLRRARLPRMVDNLITQKRIRPIALAMIDNGGPARPIEYACSDMTLGFVFEKIVGLARARLNLIDVTQQPGAYGVLGASMGGLMALYAGMRLPQMFGRVLSQSGAFDANGHDMVVFDLVRDGAVRPIRIWLDAGRFEWLLNANRRMGALLKEKGYDVAYHEYNAGHNYSAWRDDVWRGLEHLFGATANA